VDANGGDYVINWGNGGAGSNSTGNSNAATGDTVLFKIGDKNGSELASFYVDNEKDFKSFVFNGMVGGNGLVSTANSS
jgi:hypothetical protein